LQTPLSPEGGVFFCSKPEWQTSCNATVFRDGLHDFVIREGGIHVFPRVAIGENKNPPVPMETICSGVNQLDNLLGTGLDRSSSALIMGPAGCGKTTLSSQFLLAALDRGEPALCFLFEESKDTFLGRARGLGMNFEPHLASGLFELVRIDPSEVSPGEFGNQITQGVERRGARMVVIDSLNGYMNAMPSERFLMIEMHELLAWLGQSGVVTILIMAQHGLLGAMQTPADVSFLADMVILPRYFEAMGEIRQTLSVVKKRRSSHERTIREMKLGPGGVLMGEPLREFEGVLTGVPRYSGPAKPLLAAKHD
jgi:circadian clock protein KaiC